MVTSIARQSIIIKCNMKRSVMLGNYEFYYGAGLVSRISNVEIDDDIKPLELQALLTDAIETIEPKDEQEAYLFGIIKDYIPDEEYDTQMKELLLLGKNEEYLWQVNLPSQK